MLNTFKPITCYFKHLTFLCLVVPSAGFASNLCELKEIQNLASDTTVIESAQMVMKPENHCRIEGYIIINNPAPNQVNFRLQLTQDNWAGGYYFIGLDGSAGHAPSLENLRTTPLNRMKRMLS